MSSPVPVETPIADRPRILLVEDNDAANRGLSKILEIQGFEVTAVRDGATALRELQQGRPPDFLLTDLRLPDLDGREIARASRQLVPPPRVALITGWDLESDLATDHTLGIEWVFSKPLDTQDLVAKLRGVEGGRSGDLPSD